MGAAGYVVVYNEAEVRAKYAAFWPDHDIDADWWYLKTCSADLDGTRYIFDYKDDQGQHEGTGNDFWFGKYENGQEVIPPAEAQARVLKALGAVRAKCSPEVWT